MKIHRLHLMEGAAKATGLTVIIDVFRAFSLACYVIANGAKTIYPVGSLSEAYRLKRFYPDAVLMGERHEKICDGFDFGNAPTHILGIDFTGKSVIHTTSSGTQGIERARQAASVLTGSFVNARAIVRYIQEQNPSEVSLVAMGYEGIRPSQEDEFCADYIENCLRERETPFADMVEILRTGDGARLLDPANHAHSPASDFDLCLSLNRFSFVLQVAKDINGVNFLQKRDVV
ncbi:MAG TPA: 2-phosphosulfolactate phosphatase [Prolixibacteraceae bacterium]|nr:2-phosphosulfolactate phosphatase [Prolixibacteraceae bacterium]